MNKGKIIEQIIEENNDKRKICNLEIAQQQGIIQGIDYMTYKIVDILNNSKCEEHEPVESEG
ncbi:hypothetical protein SAMN02910413_1678 [Pseudobutyrivibrio sp. C4]|uniref:hypothetical protein n=1 Tax=Pseudobutyrivibrio sp. C4 TaxID=1520803 RepID=UPI0008B4E262|nr:hypothetical protein [Pseudobutyrivibrio sp. C4]SET05771.1 hypothetical protein SAMN02910413_1678 [Pseudobutyrivibrio sp. C4]